MTRKQMISTLRGMDFGSTIGSKGDEALRMAIAELEQEPCDDTISREAVLNLLDKERDEYTIQKIKVLQSVQPKPIECDDSVSRQAIDDMEKHYKDMLDKIRAEIADLDDAEYEFEGYYKAVNDALQIIDKYR